MTTASRAEITTIANFPEGLVLENLAVRADGSVLVCAVNTRQVWYVPAPTEGLPVQPILMHIFDDGQLTMSFVEARPDIFYVVTYGDATLQRIDLRGWTPGAPVSPIKVLDIEDGGEQGRLVPEVCDTPARSATKSIGVAAIPRSRKRSYAASRIASSLARSRGRPRPRRFGSTGITDS
jgi:hypothetical protein